MKQNLIYFKRKFIAAGLVLIYTIFKQVQFELASDFLITEDNFLNMLRNNKGKARHKVLGVVPNKNVDLLIRFVNFWEIKSRGTNRPNHLFAL